jgi:hypothetical protein
VNRVGRAAALLGALGLVLSGVGCTAPEPVGTTPAAPTASAEADPSAASAAATDGTIRVEIAQGRSDYASGTIALRVVNGSSDVVSVHAFALSSPAFASALEWVGESVVPVGAERDLRVEGPSFACPAPSVATEVAIGYLVGEDEREVTLSPLDDQAIIGRLSAGACTSAAVAEVAALSLDDAVAVTGSGRDAVARIDLRIEPTVTGEDRVTIAAIDATTLLAPRGGGRAWMVDRTVRAGDDPSVIGLEVVPARCDAHAIAEDKVGTILRVRVDLETTGSADADAKTDGSGAVVAVPASATLRAALYAFVASACGLE